MSKIQLCDSLQTFPLFQGMGHGDMMQIVARTKFDFLKLSANEKLIREGECCKALYLLLNGMISVETSSNDGNYTITEFLEAPQVICFDSIFGITGYYRSNVYSTTDVALMAISRRDIVSMIGTYPIIRMNAMNMLAISYHKVQKRIWSHETSGIRERITNFIHLRLQYPAGHKLVKIHMERLAEEVGDSRLNVSRALNAMKKEGLVMLSRGMINIPKFEALLK